MKKILYVFALLCIYQLPQQLHAQEPAPKPLYSDPVHDGAADHRSVIQLTELFYQNGELVCDRDKAVTTKLKRGK